MAAPNDSTVPSTAPSAPMSTAPTTAATPSSIAVNGSNVNGVVAPGEEAPGVAAANGGMNSETGGLPEPRLPTRKDASLREFLSKMDDYAPIIPDAVTHYYMTKGGLPPPPQTDPRLAKLLALATQKFIADIAADAYQYSRIRASNSASNNPMANLGGAAGFPGGGQPAGQPNSKDQGRGGPLGVQRAGYGGGGSGSNQNRTVLTMEDLGMAVGEYGVNVKRSEFYR